MTGRGRPAPHRGEVTGYLFKLIRESIPLTQEQLAVDLDVDRVTVQSWESGRRPFTAVPLGQAIAVRRRLGRLGANTVLLAALDDAAEADLIIAAVLDEQMDRCDIAEQPLGWSVLTHRLTDLILWAVLGQTPAFARGLPIARPRRGPVASGPTLPVDEQRAFFAHLHVLAERAAAGRHRNVLLHRQACFLSGMDPHQGSGRMAHPDHRARPPGNHLPHLVTAVARRTLRRHVPREPGRPGTAAGLHRSRTPRRRLRANSPQLLGLLGGRDPVPSPRRLLHARSAR
ncbi:hypothetical protein GA0070560_1159 [Micromonospora halophytica]|uniref:HTH cro/C1-type domain-containing protein n=1 Tax=Micromonospora halophytica TaxID=47864 RepID=A0A1C5IQ83_9ACTN|nr:hypothetical protein GA0070560_1159 [Micromonospora halophytica]